MLIPQLWMDQAPQSPPWYVNRPQRERPSRRDIQYVLEFLRMQIRPALPADEEAIVDFNLRLAAETEGKTLDADLLRLGVRAALHCPELARYWLACNGEELLGQLMLTSEWSDWRNGHLWWIQSVYVPPPHRRQGVLRALVTTVRELARSTPQVRGLRLYVERQNAAARAAYLQLGLQAAGYEVLEETW